MTTQIVCPSFGFWFVCWIFAVLYWFAIVGVCCWWWWRSWWWCCCWWLKATILPTIHYKLTEENVICLITIVNVYKYGLITTNIFQPNICWLFLWIFLFPPQKVFCYNFWCYYCKPNKFFSILWDLHNLIDKSTKSDEIQTGRMEKLWINKKFKNIRRTTYWQIVWKQNERKIWEKTHHPLRFTCNCPKKLFMAFLLDYLKSIRFKC